MNHVPERIPDVVTEVARRLIDIRRFAQAAELYEGIDAHREAINVYIAGGLWDQAKQLARSAAPQFAAEVEAAHKAHMQQSGAAADLVHTGNVAEGIEAYAQQNEWDRARELAQRNRRHVFEADVDGDRLLLPAAPPERDAEHERVAGKFTYPEWNRRSGDYMPDHTRVLERFGRYPHRNAACGRVSTGEEIAWLASADCPGWARSQDAASSS